jgi:phosphoserine phosphatase
MHQSSPNSRSSAPFENARNRELSQVNAIGRNTEFWSNIRHYLTHLLALNVKCFIVAALFRCVVHDVNKIVRFAKRCSNSLQGSSEVCCGEV